MYWHFTKYSIKPAIVFLGLTIAFFAKAQCPEFRCPHAERLDTAQVTPAQRLASILIGIDLSRREKNIACEANWLRRLGIFYMGSGAFKKATEAYLLAVQKSKAVGDVLAMASNNNQIGVIYYRLKEYAISVGYFKSAVALYKECPNYSGVADVGANVAEVYLLMDSVSEAEPYLRESIYARLQSGDLRNIGSDYNALGLFYSKIGRNDSAVFYIDRAIEAFNQQANMPNVISALTIKANLFLKLNRIDSALVYHHAAYDTIAKYHLFALLKESIDGLYQCYLFKQDTLTAFKYLQLGSAIADTMMTQSQKIAFIDAERKYQSEEKEREVAAKNIEIKNKNLMLLSIGIILLCTILIAVLLVMMINNRKKIAQKDTELHKKKVDELLRQQEMENVNSILKGQNIERKRIAQDLHDRLGSILATVKLHFTNVEDAIDKLHQQQGKSYEEANNLLDEACEEVRRISHDLYEGSLEKFGFATALTQLIEAIEKTNALHITFIGNNATDGTFKFYEKDLYRITQELLSNTLKYAEATKITIQCSIHNDILAYLYEDNGKGFDKNKMLSNRGIGYKNIASRVENIKGSWSLDTAQGHGMTLIIEIPLI